MRAFTTLSILILLGVSVSVQAYDLPSKLQKIYNKHKKLQGGFIPQEGSTDDSFCYCGDLEDAIYIHSHRNGGQYADMDIDCDGANSTQGRCASDQTGRSITAFQNTILGYNVGITDLDATVHPYVVFGNSGSNPSFDPKQYGIEPLSVMAVVCNEQLHYAVWGDTNGAYNGVPGIIVGEASIALADLCFPKEDLDGNKGHGAFDVMYIAFKGKDAVPGKNGAQWNTFSKTDFEDSIRKLGDKLVAKLK